MRKMFAVVMVLFPLTGSAAWFAQQFSADVMSYNSQWGKWQDMGKLYVGDAKMRMDMQQGGQQMTNIYDAKTQEMYSLNPSQRAYMETKLQDDSGVPMLVMSSMPGEAGSPCQQAKVTCNMLGEETVNGVETQKWEVVDERDPLATLRSYYWLDPSRKMAVKIQAPGGVATDRKLLGRTTIGDRRVEKWQVTTKQGDQTQQSIAYIDPQLGAIVRQEQDGQTMALTDIKVGPQPDSLFQVPTGYRKVTREEARRSGGAGTMQGMPGR